MKIFRAFTLTEILIVVGIIGVVSALTVPTLVKSYQKEAQTVQIRKVANDFVNVVDMFITEEGKTSFKTTSVFTDNNGLTNFITNKFKVVKACDRASDCFYAGDYRSLDGNHSSSFPCEGGNAYLLANSAAICVQTTGGNTLVVYVDTNGAEEPNIGGRDMFKFYINANGELTTWRVNIDGCSEYGDCSNICPQKPFGETCIQVLRRNNWEMNY